MGKKQKNGLQMGKEQKKLKNRGTVPNFASSFSFDKEAKNRVNEKTCLNEVKDFIENVADNAKSESQQTSQKPTKKEPGYTVEASTTTQAGLFNISILKKDPNGKTILEKVSQIETRLGKLSTKDDVNKLKDELVQLITDSGLVTEKQLQDVNDNLTNLYNDGEKTKEEFINCVKKCVDDFKNYVQDVIDYLKGKINQIKNQAENLSKENKEIKYDLQNIKDQSNAALDSLNSIQDELGVIRNSLTEITEKIEDLTQRSKDLESTLKNLLTKDDIERFESEQKKLEDDNKILFEKYKNSQNTEIKQLLENYRNQFEEASYQLRSSFEKFSKAIIEANAAATTAATKDVNTCTRYEGEKTRKQNTEEHEKTREVLRSSFEIFSKAIIEATTAATTAATKDVNTCTHNEGETSRKQNTEEHEKTREVLKSYTKEDIQANSKPEPCDLLVRCDNCGRYLKITDTMTTAIDNCGCIHCSSCGKSIPFKLKEGDFYISTIFSSINENYQATINDITDFLSGDVEGDVLKLSNVPRAGKYRIDSSIQNYSEVTIIKFIGFNTNNQNRQGLLEIFIENTNIEKLVIDIGGTTLSESNIRIIVYSVSTIKSREDTNNLTIVKLIKKEI